MSRRHRRLRASVTTRTYARDRTQDLAPADRRTTDSELGVDRRNLDAEFGVDRHGLDTELGVDRRGLGAEILDAEDRGRR